MALYDRRLYARVSHLLGQFPAVVVTGARQVGKSTLARMIAALRPSIGFDLEKMEDRQRLGTNPGAVLRKHLDKLVILDEVQNVPGLFQELRSVIDDARAQGNKHGKFLLLGSATGRLMRQTGETLAGRVASIRLHGLDWLEIAADGDIDRLWDRGGYPESYLAADDEASIGWRLQYLRHEMRHHVRALGVRIEPDNLYKMLGLIADKQGSTTVMADLARDQSVAHPTVGRYLGVLEDMMLIRRLPPYSRNIRKRIVKQPKYYFCDSGLLHAYCKVTPLGDNNPIMARLLGASWEGFVIENIMAVLPMTWSASFYRDVRDNEIDLILERPGARPWAIEIKRSPTAGLTKSCRRALSALKPERTFLVHGETGQRSLGNNYDSIGLGAMMNELLAQAGEGVGSVRLDPPAHISGACDTLLDAISSGKPNAPLLRRDFVKSSLKQTEAILRETTGVLDKNFRLGWAQLRDELLRWLDAESNIALDDTSASNYVKGLRDVLEGLLKIKRSHAGMGGAKSIAAGWCAHNMFVNVISVLRQSEKYKVIHYLLSRVYAGNSPSREFSLVPMPQENGSSEDYQRFALETSRAGADALLEAEIIILLFDVFASCDQKEQQMVRWPRLLDGNYPKPDFLLWVQSPEGRDSLQACVGVDCDKFAKLNECMQMALDESELDEAYKQRVLDCLKYLKAAT